MIKLIKSNKDNFDKVFEDMLLQFPKEELNKKEDYLNLLEKDSYCLFEASDKGESVGYCLLFQEHEKSVLWLDYVAVFKSFHSKGYGKKIFADLADNFKDFKGIYLEVEKPEETNPNTLRRIKFYTNLGAVKLDCEHYYPNPEGFVSLDLYFLPFSKNCEIPSRKEAVETVHCVFNEIHSANPNLSAVLSKIK